MQGLVIVSLVGINVYVSPDWLSALPVNTKQLLIDGTAEVLVALEWMASLSPHLVPTHGSAGNSEVDLRRQALEAMDADPDAQITLARQRLEARLKEDKVKQALLLVSGLV